MSNKEEDSNIAFLNEMSSFCDTTTNKSPKGILSKTSNSNAEIAYQRHKARSSDKRVRIGLRSTTPPPRSRISGDSPCSERQTLFSPMHLKTLFSRLTSRLDQVEQSLSNIDAKIDSNSQEQLKISDRIIKSKCDELVHQSASSIASLIADQKQSENKTESRLIKLEALKKSEYDPLRMESLETMVREIHIVIQRYKSVNIIASQNTQNKMENVEKKYKEQFLSYTSILDNKIKRHSKITENRLQMLQNDFDQVLQTFGVKEQIQQTAFQPVEEMQHKLDHTCKRMASLENEIAKILHKSSLEAQNIYRSTEKRSQSPLRTNANTIEKDWAYLDNNSNNENTNTNAYNFSEIDNQEFKLSEQIFLKTNSELKGSQSQRGPSESLKKSLQQKGLFDIM